MFASLSGLKMAPVALQQGFRIDCALLVPWKAASSKFLVCPPLEAVVLGTTCVEDMPQIVNGMIWWSGLAGGVRMVMLGARVDSMCREIGKSLPISRALPGRNAGWIHRCKGEILCGGARRYLDLAPMLHDDRLSDDSASSFDTEWVLRGL